MKKKKAIALKKAIPFDFVLELLAELDPYTKPMFGCTSVYVGPKIVLILRDRQSPPSDDGIWIATTGEHHESLRREMPSMRDIEIFGPGPTGWQVLPVSADDFEESVQHVCDLILQDDPRVGKIPKARVSKGLKSKKKAAAKKPATTGKKAKLSSRRGSR